MKGRRIPGPQPDSDRWPPVDRWPPADGCAEHWQHPEERLALHEWSVEDQWLPLDVILAGLDDDDSY